MSRRVTVRTAHGDATQLAGAISPDNTDEIETRVDDDAVVTTIERETTSGLQATVDDYVVNLEVAIDVLETAARARGDDTTRTTDHATQPNRADRPADTGPVSDDDNTTNNE